MRKLSLGRWGSDATTLIFRLVLLYLLWGICRICFYISNKELIGAISWDEAAALFSASVGFDTISILYINALFIILSLLPFRFRERRTYQRILFWYYTVFNSLALIVNMSDSVYFHYVKKRFTADELSYLTQNDNNLSIIGQGMVENWFLVLIWALLVVVMVFGYKHISYSATRIKNKVWYFIVSLFIMLLGMALTIGGIRGGFGSSRPPTISNAAFYTSSAAKANLILSNPFCMIRTMGNPRIEYTKFYNQQALDSIYTPYHYPTASRLSLGQRNIVLVILESFSSEHSALLNPDLYPDGDGYTPYLDSLMREGYYFTEAYTSGRKSIDALPSMLSSIPSYKKPFVLLPRAVEKSESLPNILATKGYETAFFNGSERGSMGFGAYTNIAGIKNYYSMEDYEKANGKGDYDGWWGIWDLPMLQFMSDKLSTMNQPFFASVFTLSSHHPFKVPKEYDNLPEGRTKLHKGVAYTDIAIRNFMKSASQKSWFNNTLFIFAADHVSSETFAPKTRTTAGGSHIIAFLYTPDGAIRGVDGQPFSQLDVMPTILGLIGNTKPYFGFGRDIFGEPELLPMAVNYVNDRFQAVTDSLVVISDGTVLTELYSRSDTLQTKNMLPMQSDYLKFVEKQLNARIQQYYQHIEKGDFIVKPKRDSAAN